MILPGEVRRKVELFTSNFEVSQLPSLAALIIYSFEYSTKEERLDKENNIYKKKVEFLFKDIIDKECEHIAENENGCEDEKKIHLLNEAKDTIQKFLYTAVLDLLLEYEKGKTNYTKEEIENNLIIEHFMEYGANNSREEIEAYIEIIEAVLKFFLTEPAVTRILSLYKKFNKFEEYTMEKQTKYLNEKLKSLIGLESIKKELKSLQNLAYINKKREKENLRGNKVSMHMVFTGNPGTGKTTVARIISEIYYNLGLISKNKVYEVSREDLVAGYLGQSENKTKEVLEKARGGVLFIDEAYSLTEKEDDYGSAVINTLLKFMEDNRDNTIIIVAGYPKQMQKFIKSNPGLESRFSKVLHFENYSSEEMIEILKVFMEENDYEITSTELNKVFKLFEKIDKTSEDFSNARFVRNIFEKATTNQANRLAETGNYDDKELKKLEYEDFLDK